MLQRTVRAYVSDHGRYLGTAGPVPTTVPWWSETRTVTAALDQLVGARTAVLRLVSASGGDPPGGGEVTYHVETFGRPHGLDERPVDGWADLVSPHQLRSPWATAAGLRDLIDWAEAAATAAGSPPVGPPVQVKSWNLSCVLTLPTARGPVWAKATPVFGNSEAAIIDAVRAHDPTLAPAVIARDDAARRALLAHVPGEDCFTVDTATACAVIRRWVAVQAAITGTLDDIPGLRRPDPVTATGDMLRSVRGLTPAERAAAGSLHDQLPALVAEIARDGLPTTLVHGDFHPGNWRSDGSHHAIIDWADAFAGHPAADVLRLVDRLAEPQREPVLAAWADAWSTHRPGSHPKQGLAAMRVLCHLQLGADCQRFLDAIEPSEQTYHEADPPAEIRAALAAR